MRCDISEKTKNTYENGTGRLLNTMYGFVTQDGTKLCGKVGYVYGSGINTDRVMKVTHNGADIFGYNYGNLFRIQ